MADSVDLLGIEPTRAADELATSGDASNALLILLGAALKALEVDIDGVDLKNLTDHQAAHLQSSVYEAVAELKKKSAGPSADCIRRADENDEWTEYAEDTHVPSFSIDSPVVRNVLSTWTDEEAKRDYFLFWAKSLNRPAGSGYPPGIQITRVSRVLRDAFLMLVLPVLKQMCADKVVATVREHRIAPPSEEKVLESGQDANLDMELSSDPFLTQLDVAFDLRFRRWGHHAEARTDIQNGLEADCTPLSEIDHVFKELEHKAKEEMLAHELRRQQRNSFSVPAETRSRSRGSSFSGFNEWTHSLTAWLKGSPAPAINHRASFSDFATHHSPHSDPRAVIDSYGNRTATMSRAGLPLEARAMMASRYWFQSDGFEGPRIDAYRPPMNGNRAVSVDSGAKSKNNVISERLAALRANK